MRQDPERDWTSVLTIDTDTHEQMSLDALCKFNVDTAETELGHFCKYAWCGRRKENASLSRKLLGCSLYARMDTAGLLSSSDTQSIARTTQTGNTVKQTVITDSPLHVYVANSQLH